MNAASAPVPGSLLKCGLLYALAAIAGHAACADAPAGEPCAPGAHEFALAMDHGEQRLRAHSFAAAEADFLKARALAGDPRQSAAAGLALGRLYRQSGHRGQAVEEFEEVLAIAGAPASERGHAAFLIGHCLREDKRFGEASAAYAEAAAILPEDSRLWLAARYYEALAVHQAGERELALAAYEELAAMERYPVLADMLQPRMQRLRIELETDKP